MTEPDLRTPPGPTGSLAAGKRAGLAADPRAVYQGLLRGRRSTIRAKRPYYGVQHSRHQAGVELSPETLATDAYRDLPCHPDAAVVRRRLAGMLGASDPSGHR